MNTSRPSEDQRRIVLDAGLYACEHDLDLTAPVTACRVDRLHKQMLGPGRAVRKKQGSFERDGERGVRDRLRLHGRELYLPRAEASLRSLVESGALPAPEIGQRYSVYAMLPGDHVVALIRQRDGAGTSTELPALDVDDAACIERAENWLLGITEASRRIEHAAWIDAFDALSRFGAFR